MAARTHLFLLFLIFGLQLAKAAPSCLSVAESDQILAFDQHSNVLLHMSAQALSKINQRFSDLQFEGALREEYILKKISTVLESPNVSSWLGAYRPTFQAGGLQWKAHIQQIQVSFPMSPVQKSGVILNAEVHLESLQIQSEGWHADLVAPGLGRVGFDRFSIETPRAFRVQLPLSLNFDSHGEPEIQILSLDGIDLKALGLKMEGLVIPRVEIKVDGQTLTPAVLENLQKHAWQLLQDKSWIGKLTPQLLSFLNSLIKSHLKLAPVSVETTQLQRFFTHQLGLDPSRTKPLSVMLSLRNIESLADGAVTFSARVQTNGSELVPPGKCFISCQPHDIALAVHESWLRELAADLWSKSYFYQMKVAPGKYVTLLEPPTIQPTPSRDHKSHFKINVTVKPESALGLNFFVKENFSVKAQIELAVSPNQEGKGLKVELVKIETQGVAFDERDLRLPFRVAAKLTPNFVIEALQNLVVTYIHAKMKNGQLNQSWPLESVLGPTQIVGIHFDPSGHLYFLLNMD